MDKNELIGAIQKAGQQEARLSLHFRHQIALKAGSHATDMECVDFIVSHGRVTPGQLCEATGLSSGAMTAALGRLEKQNLIKRQQSRTDKRSVYVTANMKEVQKISVFYLDFVKNATELLHTYTETELRTILHHYEKMSEIYASELRSDEGRR